MTCIYLTCMIFGGKSFFNKLECIGIGIALNVLILKHMAFND